MHWTLVSPKIYRILQKANNDIYTLETPTSTDGIHSTMILFKEYRF